MSAIEYNDSMEEKIIKIAVLQNNKAHFIE